MNKIPHRSWLFYSIKNHASFLSEGDTFLSEGDVVSSEGDTFLSEGGAGNSEGLTVDSEVGTWSLEGCVERFLEVGKEMLGKIF